MKSSTNVNVAQKITLFESKFAQEACSPRRFKESRFRRTRDEELSDDSSAESNICGLDRICPRRRANTTAYDPGRLACDFARKIPQPEPTRTQPTFNTAAVAIRSKGYLADYVDIQRSSGGYSIARSSDLSSQHGVDWNYEEKNTFGEYSSKSDAIDRNSTWGSVASPFTQYTRRVYSQGSSHVSQNFVNPMYSNSHSTKSDSELCSPIYDDLEHFVFYPRKEAPAAEKDCPKLAKEIESPFRTGRRVYLQEGANYQHCIHDPDEEDGESDDSADYDSWEIYEKNNTGATAKHEDLVNNNEQVSRRDSESASSENESDICRNDQEQGADSSYESQSSYEFLYCREECNNNCPSEGSNDEDCDECRYSEPEGSDGPYSANSSGSSASAPTSGSIVITRKHESVKRSSRALEGECGNGCTHCREHSIKRFRSNEGLAVTPPSAGLAPYSSDSSSSCKDSPLAASSCTTETVIYSVPSPFAGQEAEAECCGPNEPNGCSSDTYDEYDYKWDETDGGESSLLPDDSSDPGGIYSAFRYHDNPLPFQLHPVHHENLEEYYSFMQEKELISHPSHCLEGQQKIRGNMRRILIEWLTMIAHHYKLNGESIHLTVNILDRYTERQKGIYRGHYQLLGVTSLLVATKQLEVDMPPVATCLMLCRNLYSKAQMLSLERHLLDILSFDLNVPTAHTFLDYYIITKHRDSPLRTLASEAHYLSGPCYLKKVLCVARCLLDFGLADYNFSQYLPSVAARAAMKLAEDVVAEREVGQESLYATRRAGCRSSFPLVGFQTLHYGDEAGYADPEAQYLRGYSGSREYMQKENGDSERRIGYHPRSTALRSIFDEAQYGSRGLCTEEGFDRGEVQECTEALRSLVGDGAIRNIQLTVDKVIVKYSFE